MIKKSDFNFEKVSDCEYYVTYTSPKTTMQWSNTVDDKKLIELVVIENPMQKHLEYLKKVCKKKIKY